MNRRSESNVTFPEYEDAPPIYSVDIGDDGFPRYTPVRAKAPAPKPKIQVLVGMIASGKSTYCRNAAKRGIITMNDDAIVNLLHGNDYTLYDKALKTFYKSIENQIIGTALCMQRTVIVDRGLNGSVQGRQRWIALARSFDVNCEAIVFPHDGVETHARRRADSDSRGHPYDYWLMVAKAHNENWSIPTVDEGFAAIHHIDFNTVLSGKVFE